MKFSTQIQLNTVPEWNDKYLDYSALKKLIYAIEKDTLDSNIQTPINDSNFTAALDTQLQKIVDFYKTTEQSLFSSILHGLLDVDLKVGKISARLIELYVEAMNLQNYVQLNHTGFEKILKKFDKVTGLKLKRNYMSIVDSSYPFNTTTIDQLSLKISSIISGFGKINSFDHETSLKELNDNLNLIVKIERNTIWRDMISLENQRGNTVLVNQPESNYSLKVILLVFSILVFTTLLNLSLFSSIEETNCFALLVFAILLWSFEIIPLFTTSLVIPFLIVLLRVYKDENGIRLTSKQSSKRVFSEMFSPVVMLLLGGFTLAAALSKHSIAKRLANYILIKAGSRREVILLSMIFISTFSSMWISNVASPVLCFELIKPILRNLPIGSSFAKALVLGIALSANIGGMASPISSPQVDLYNIEYNRNRKHGSKTDMV